MGQWVFSELRGDDVRRDPNEAELFKTEQTAEGEYAGNDALVREILQNAIDARSPNTPVYVRLAVYEAKDAPPAAKLAQYFARLKTPLAARQVDYNEDGTPKVPCRFLLVEDFGTRGLEGDPMLFRDPPPNHKTPQYFYWFWRNIGRSGKTGDDLGRWGLGKTVYRAVSRVGCMFGFTVRESDRRRFLMGQAVLQIHEQNGKEYKPEGYWCAAQNSAGVPMPIEDAVEALAFCQEWRIARTVEPGLSVVAPFVPDEVRADRLLQAVAVHFFTRILRGELVVEVMGEGVGRLTLDRAGLAEACKKIKWDGPVRTKRHMSPPIDFALKCVGTKPASTTELLGIDKVPEVNETLFPEAKLHDLRRMFAAGEMISIRVRLFLPRCNQPPQEGQLDVFLMRLPDGARCDSYYVREGMTITKINSQSAKRGVQSLVLVEPGPLAELLGDTEGPAHEDWDTSAERPDKSWARGWKGRVKFVRKIVDDMVELLTPPTKEPDFDRLSDFFSIEQTNGKQRPTKEGTIPPLERGGEGGSSVPEIVSEPKWYNINAREGGFTVSRVQAVPKPPDTALRISVAYDLPRGNPLASWSPLDFNISGSGNGLRPTGKGMEVVRVDGNVLMLKNIKDTFAISIDGFDRHRDLFVRVDEVRTGEEVES